MADSPRLDNLPRPRPVKASIDRRNLASRRFLIDRISGEFREMPGISLTLPQASRLFGISADIGGRVLERLVDEQVLMRSADGRYRQRHSAA